jgi:hypothetical protein
MSGHRPLASRTRITTLRPQRQREGTRTPQKHERLGQRPRASSVELLVAYSHTQSCPERGKRHPATATRRHQAATRSPVGLVVCSGYGHPAWSPWHAAANRGIQCPDRFPVVPRDVPRQRPSHGDRVAIPLIEQELILVDNAPRAACQARLAGRLSRGLHRLDIWAQCASATSNACRICWSSPLPVVANRSRGIW